jgi:hypothetical protein
MTEPHDTSAVYSWVTLHRRKTPWRDRLIRYRVVVDGTTIGKIANGESSDFPLTPGDHRIRLVTQLLFTSRPVVFSIRAGEVAEFNCSAGGSAVLTLFGVLRPHRYIALDGPTVSTV